MSSLLDSLSLHLDDLSDPRIAAFMEEHLQDMRATSPPESVHALDMAGLRRPESRAQDSALFIGEFGTGPGLRPWIHDVIDLADRQMLGFTWWSYDAGGWGITNPDGSEARHARDVARPYPQAVAGVPDAFSYDRARHAFRLDFHTREGVEGPTEIYVGARRHFPDGWQVTVVGGSGAPADLSYDARREVLLVDVPQSAEPWTVCITRAGRACPARGTSRG